MGNVIDFATAHTRRHSPEDALALRDAMRLRDACKRIAARVGALSLDDGVQLGHELDLQMIDGLESLAARLAGQRDD